MDPAQNVNNQIDRAENHNNENPGLINPNNELDTLDVLTLRRMRSVLQERIREFQRVFSRHRRQVPAEVDLPSAPSANLDPRPIISPPLQPLASSPTSSMESSKTQPTQSQPASMTSTQVSPSKTLLPFEVPSLDQNAKSIQDFPNEVMSKILRYLTFESIGKKRLVSKRFNTICCSILNSEFKCLRNSVQHRLHDLKSQMPRRESARRQHALAREFDIIETINMRLSLMYTMFSKHIDREHCPFFAGQVLDEVRRILTYLKTTPVLEFAYKVTDELFDLSTMAVEYFKEHIEPTLPDVTYISGFNDCFLFDNGSSSPGNSVEGAPGTSKSFDSIAEYSSMNASSIEFKFSEFSESKSSLNTSFDNFSSITKRPSLTLNRLATRRIKKLEVRNKKATSVIKCMRSDLKVCKQKLNQSQKQIRKYQTHFEDYDQKLEATCSKLSSVLEELSKCKTEIQYLRSTTNLQSQDHPTASINSQPALATTSSVIVVPLNESPFAVPTKIESAKRKLDLVTSDESSTENDADSINPTSSNKQVRFE